MFERFKSGRGTKTGQAVEFLSIKLHCHYSKASRVRHKPNRLDASMQSPVDRVVGPLLTKLERVDIAGIPLGNFHTGEPGFSVPPPYPRDPFERLGFAEVYWAKIPSSSGTCTSGTQRCSSGWTRSWDGPLITYGATPSTCDA
jgi:hypothetical protein